MENIISQCDDRAVELLLKNSSKFGVLASSPSPKAIKRNYLSIFGRDASISTLGMVVSGNKKLVSVARKSIVTLGRFQADDGQIPNFVKPEEGRADFWYTGCIDATLWWLIAIKYYDKYSKDKNKLEKVLKKKIDKATFWLRCQEHNNFFLLQQGEVSDWADIMPRSGFVLYSNALWYWVKTMYRLPKIKETKIFFNYLFNPNNKIPKSFAKKHPRFGRLVSYFEKCKKNDYYLSYVNRSFWGKEVDVFGNLLAIISGLTSDKQAKDIIKKLLKEKVNLPHPIKVELRPIKKNSKQWRDYMNEDTTNLPNLYHNGGIWPFVGGFWIWALDKTGNKKIASTELERLAVLNAKGNWQFNEWFHGKTGRPMGMPGQTWNAAMFLFASDLSGKK